MLSPSRDQAMTSGFPSYLSWNLVMDEPFIPASSSRCDLMLWYFCAFRWPRNLIRRMQKKKIWRASFYAFSRAHFLFLIPLIGISSNCMQSGSVLEDGIQIDRERNLFSTQRNYFMGDIHQINSESDYNPAKCIYHDTIRNIRTVCHFVHITPFMGHFG